MAKKQKTTRPKKSTGKVEQIQNDVDRLNRKSPLPRNIAAKQTTPSSTQISRGAVDAPGKRHRKALPPEPLDKRMGEPRGKQSGQKNAKTGRHGGRR